MKTTGTKIFKASHLLCGSEFNVKKNMALVVEGGVIQENNSCAKIAAQSDAIICDCSDLFLVHGLVDALNHLSLDFHLPNYLERIADPLPALLVLADKNMQEDLLAASPPLDA